MADAAALKAYGLSDEDIAGLMAFDLGKYQAEQQRRGEIVSSRDADALAAARATGISNIDMYANPIGADEIIPGSQASIMAGLGMYNPAYQTIMRTYGSSNDRDDIQDVTERSTFAIQPDASYRLVDNKTGKVIATAANPTEVRSLVDMANSMSEDQGAKANWSIEQSGLYSSDPSKPLEQSWTSVASDKLDNDMGPMGSVLDVALPILLSAAIPGAGFLGTMLPAAGGAAASSALQGRSLEETLIRSALAGATAGIGEKFITPALNSVLKPVSDVASNAASNVASNVAAQAAADAAGQGISDIVVTAIPKLVSGLGSGLSSALGSGISSALTNASSYTPPSSPTAQPEPIVEPSELVVNAIRNPVLNTATSAITNAIPQYVVDNYGAYEPQPEPTTRRDPDTGEEEIVVTAKDQPFLLDSVAQALVNQTLPELTQTPEITKPEKTLKDDIKDVIKTVAAVSPLIPLAGVAADAVFGGGGGGIGGGGGPGLTFNPIILTSTIPAGGIGAVDGIGGRYPYTPTTYGLAGGDQETEYEFFTRSRANPVAAVPAVPPAAPGKRDGGEIQDDMVKHLVEYQKGGGHRGPGKVTGIGSGQEDLIPAWLSDGEYVWSAQDVADLGDGSTDEGVRRLDKMRQMVRRQAGRKDVKKIAKPQKGIDTMLKAVGGQA